MHQPPPDPIDNIQPAEATKPGLDIGRCLNDAMDVFTKNLLLLVFASFLFTVLSVFTLGVLAGPLCGGFSIMTLEAMRREDKTIELPRLFAGFENFLSLLILFIVVVVAALIGTIFLIIPGLVIMTLWLFPFYLVMDKRIGIWDSGLPHQNRCLIFSCRSGLARSPLWV